MLKYEDLKHKDRERRSYNYKQLRDVGFNSFESNRYKDFSTTKIVFLIESRKKYNKEQKELAGDSNG